MIEVKIPSFKWNNEDWVIKKLDNIKNAVDVLKICDGSVRCVLLDYNKIDDYRESIDDILRNIDWIKKRMIKQGDNLIGIFARK